MLNYAKAKAILRKTQVGPLAMILWLFLGAMIPLIGISIVSPEFDNIAAYLFSGLRAGGEVG
jgi:hypothetical protein